jgi:hypothetical protein
MIIATIALALAVAPDPKVPAAGPARVRLEAGRAKLEAELAALEARATSEAWQGPSVKARKRVVNDAFDAASGLWISCIMDASARFARGGRAAEEAADAGMEDCAAFEADFRRTSALAFREEGAPEPEARSELVRRDAHRAARLMAIGAAHGGLGKH